FLSLGHYDAQIRRTSKALHSRRRALEESVARHGLTVAGRGAYGGSSLWMQAPAAIDTARLADRLRPQGVLIEPGAPFFAGIQRPQNLYRLGYSSIPESRIDRGVEMIAQAIATGWT
ncbi:MAG: GntR family transcriptional regulator, partial [Pseudomonadota bacterium]|nr:GntR family transcriptional regulator [Pseudomonadota bacterium]